MTSQAYVMTRGMARLLAPNHGVGIVERHVGGQPQAHKVDEVDRRVVGDHLLVLNERYAQRQHLAVKELRLRDNHA